MRQPLSIALAASLAVSAIGMSAAPASAHDGRAALAIFGAIAGLAAVAAASQYPYPYYYYGDYPERYHRYPYYGYNAHVRWCLDHYRTYDPGTNTYFARPGVQAVCYAPF